ncbi:hypothetical protein C922_03321 [Plasmodium inui San Antonio 1]|uniref:Uncharacterized protein n=1 Tax=Plasmodium inui San Antonio 1 TaxID=1237626 RepID=W7A413_9APIC|nr:hypothetical protein C922_03321 [Plasmodium inui San Antonio 1]EUD66405.1 hypothetical protein C922_03321 [Plasmodium inui San Antonio 1]
MKKRNLEWEIEPNSKSTEFSTHDTGEGGPKTYAQPEPMLVGLCRSSLSSTREDRRDLVRKEAERCRGETEKQDTTDESKEAEIAAGGGEAYLIPVDGGNMKELKLDKVKKVRTRNRGVWYSSRGRSQGL